MKKVFLLFSFFLFGCGEKIAEKNSEKIICDEKNIGENISTDDCNTCFCSENGLVCTNISCE